jgi:hypothetical protein
MDTYYFSKVIFKLLKIVNNPDRKWDVIRKFPAFFFYPHMERKEYFLFKELCKNKTVFLEYGSGGSTIYLLKENKTVFSVESNPEFYHYMCSIKLIRQALNSNLHYKFVNIGPTNKWGKPLSEEYSQNWPKYYEQIWQEIDPAIHQVDVIFIDGRFRVSCCLYSILKAAEYNWKNTIFVVHDFWRREKYHVVLDFLQEIKSAENLVSLRMKDNIDIDDLKERLEQYAFVIA